MKITILYSGGLDSRIMALYAGRTYPDAEVKKLFFDIGQPYLHKELAALPEDVEVRKVDWLREAPVGKAGSTAGDIFVPGRNMTLATLAASLTCPDEIWLGALAGETNEGATDKNFEFLGRLNSVLSYVMAPFVPNCRARFPLAEASMGKFEAVQYGLNHGLTASDLMATSSCLSGTGTKCGTCIVCFRRWGIFRQLGFAERYDSDLAAMLEANDGFIGKLVDGHYDEFRTREVLPAILNAWSIDCDWNPKGRAYLYGAKNAKM